MASRIGAERAGTKAWPTENVVAMGGRRYRRGEYGSGFRECTSLNPLREHQPSISLHRTRGIILQLVQGI